MAATKKLTGGVLTVERTPDDLRNITITITCPHGSATERVSSKKNARLGEAYFKLGLAMKHAAKYKCGCEFSEAAVKPARKTRAKKEAAA